MWALIDNYDSFSHILHDYLLQTGHECALFRNDEISIAELEQKNISRLIISPGPETPVQAGISLEAIQHFHQKIPILGICLGHQAIGMLFGGSLKHNPQPVHGKVSPVQHEQHPIFEGISNPFPVMRYHSLCIELQADSPLQALAAATDDGVLMALSHSDYPIIGLQFHPESIGTPDGLRLLRNWSKWPAVRL